MTIIDEQKKGSGWTKKINKILLFEFQNSTNHFQLLLIIGPGELEARKKLVELTKSNKLKGFGFKKSEQGDEYFGEKNFSRIYEGVKK